MAIKQFCVNNNNGLAALDGVTLSLSFTINYTDDDTSNTQLLRYTLGQGSGRVTFDNGLTSITQTVDTPGQLNPNAPGSIRLQGGASGTVSVTVSASGSSGDIMVLNYTAKTRANFAAIRSGTRAATPASKKAVAKKEVLKDTPTKKIPVLFGVRGQAKRSVSKKVSPKPSSPKKAVPEKAAAKRAAPEKAAAKKAAAKEAAPKKPSKKAKPHKIPVLWKKK